MEYLSKGISAAKKMAASASGALGLEKRMDRSLEDHAAKLKHLEQMQKSLKMSFQMFQKKAVSQSQAQLKLAKHVALFYKTSKSRQKSIQDFIQIHRSIDELSAGTFGLQFDDVVTSVIDEWTDLTKKASNYLDKTNRQIMKVRKEEIELHRLLKRGEPQQVLQEKQRALTVASRNVDEMKSELKIMVSKLVDMRFNIFDECFVRLMETQVSYYENAASMIGSLNMKIKQYRSKRPRVLSSPVEKLISPLPPRILGTDSKRDGSPAPQPMERPSRTNAVRSQERKRVTSQHPPGEYEDEDEDEDEGLDEPAPSIDTKRDTTAVLPQPHIDEGDDEDEDEDENLEEVPRIELTIQDQRAIAQAEVCKNQGGIAFKASKFEEAIKHYNNAIKVLGYDKGTPNLERADEVLDLVCSCLSNKAMCEKQLHNHKNIVTDTTLCIQLKPVKAMVVKNLVKRGFAYMALDKMQEALNDLLSARNMGCTTPAVMKAISQAKKEATVPSKIQEYQCRKPKAEKKVRSVSAQPASNAHSGAQAAQPTGAIDILGLGGAPPPAQQPPVDSQAPGQAPNLFDWESPMAGSGSKSQNVQPNKKAPSWMNLDSTAQDPMSILGGFGGAPTPKPAPTAPKQNGKSNSSFGINYDDIFSSADVNPKPSEIKHSPAQAESTTADDEPEQHIEGGPITQITHILESLSENDFWSFAQHNLSAQQLRSTPRDRKMAIKHCIHCGINSPSFYEGWKEQIAEQKYKVALDQWEFRAGVRKDLMALLSGLHNLMEIIPWKGKKWKRVGLGDLQDAGKRRKYYKKAMLAVHPDHNTNASPAQRAIAERAFNAMTEALKKEPPY